MLAKKTWRIVAIRQIRQNFLPAKVLFYTVHCVVIQYYVHGYMCHQCQYSYYTIHTVMEYTYIVIIIVT